MSSKSKSKMSKAKQMISKESKKSSGKMLALAPFKREMKNKLKHYSSADIKITADALHKSKGLVETYILHMLKTALRISVELGNKLTVGEKELQYANMAGCAYFTGKRRKERIPQMYQNAKGKKFLFSEKSIRDMAKSIGIQRLSKDALPIIRWMIHECAHALAKYSNILRDLNRRKTVTDNDIQYAFESISKAYEIKWFSDSETWSK